MFLFKMDVWNGGSTDGWIKGPVDESIDRLKDGSKDRSIGKTFFIVILQSYVYHSESLLKYILNKSENATHIL